MVVISGTKENGALTALGIMATDDFTITLPLYGINTTGFSVHGERDGNVMTSELACLRAISGKFWFVRKHFGST